MACPVCPAAGWFGGWIGGYLGIYPPEHPAGRILSAGVTATLISITVIALKTLFHISLCTGDGLFTLTNITLVIAKTVAMGIVYSIGVNYLLNRYVYPPVKREQQEDDSLTECSNDDDVPCCCKNKNEAEVNQTS